ncbi:MAG: T9SS type A sorting domain-containing protein, partial [Saprospiraceae bacterium]|nr:T9SS type A sorting domain-containing protein [Saprospiraceae bacterium]
RTPAKNADKDTNDNSCNYPDQVFNLIKGEGAFDFNDGETKYVYIQAQGNVFCGNILLEPKTGNNCYYDERVPGPQCTEGCDDTQLCSLVDIGTWDPNECNAFNLCQNVLPSYTIGSNTIVFHGYENSGNDSYWYYEITSGTSPSISHLTFGLICPNGSIGDYVWHDVNNNGVQDNGETGINGVTVRLYDGNNNLLSTMVTMQNPNDDKLDGYYMFTNLAAGDYYLTFEYPLGYNISPIDRGGDDEMDSDIMPGGTSEMAETAIITLESSEDDITIDGGLSGTPVLPVRFGDFSIHNKRNQIELKWTTLSEINNEGFYIEKSTDNSEFHEIGFVKGIGNSNAINEYSYVDLNLGRSTLFSYRLRQTDTDGHVSYSAIRSLRLHSGVDYDVFPNPTTGIISMILPETASTKQIRIYNTVGQMIYSLQVNQGSKYYQLDISEFEEGVYFIRLEDGINSKIKRVILNY